MPVSLLTFGIRLFDYTIPNEIASHIQAGSLVIIPFGQQIVQGIVIALVDSPAVENPRPLIDLLDPAPVLTPPQIALAILLAETTLVSAGFHCQPDAPDGIISTGRHPVFSDQRSVISK